MKENKIINVIKDSIADELKIKTGDYLVSINGNEIIDILDYKYYTSEEYLEVLIKRYKKDGSFKEYIYEIEKDDDEDIGLVFVTDLIDEPKNCRNKCIFCFMDQMPKNVRESLIFKDDDYRLSFFSGNYITLTNLKETDIDRIIKYRVSPINISVHTTNENIRCMMLNNRYAGQVLKYMDTLNQNNIKMNVQIVLCKDINDKEILEQTIKDLEKYMPNLLSICIVPVGLSKYRQGLYNLKLLNKEDCLGVIQLISKYQEYFKKKYNTRLIYIADEFYLKAEYDIPKYKEYEDFCQLENGVGMISLFEKEFSTNVKKLITKLKKQENNKYNNVKIINITGKITEKYFKEKINILKDILNYDNIDVLAVENKFFGENITVTGLVTGTDIIDSVNEKITQEALKSEDTYVIIPDVMLKEDEDIFLDDVTLEKLKKEIKANVIVKNTDAKSTISSIYDILVRKV